MEDGTRESGPVKHEQDWLILAEALAEWLNGDPDVSDPRKARGWELLRDISIHCGVREGDLGAAIDPTWSGPDG